MSSKRLKIMVSSTVYGIEELLERIYTILTAYDYEVWMSHKGTMPVFSNQSAFENCIKAVENCDLFLGLITPRYGSGKIKDELSITHQELRKAIELKKLRWVLVHENIIFARRFLIDLGFKGKQGRSRLNLKEHGTSIDDLRIIDMYEDALRSEIPLPERKGNWVQKYESDIDADTFIVAQFSRYHEVEAFIEENLVNNNKVQIVTK